MKIFAKTTALFFFSITLFTACGEKPCHSNNKIFNSVSPDAKEYREELARVLANSDKKSIHYYVNACWQRFENNKPMEEFLRVHVNGNNICADMILDIRDSRKGIEDVLKKQMMGYAGAELEGMEYDIIKDSLKTIFVFRSVADVID